MESGLEGNPKPTFQRQRLVKGPLVSVFDRYHQVFARHAAPIESQFQRSGMGQPMGTNEPVMSALKAKAIGRLTHLNRNVPGRVHQLLIAPTRATTCFAQPGTGKPIQRNGGM